jgi:hypothetical protein
MKRLFPEDFRRYKAYFSNQRYEISAYSLASILAWSNQVYHPYGMVRDNMLIVGVTFNDPEKPHHLILPIAPVGEYTPEELHDLALELDYTKFQFVPEDYLHRFDKWQIADLFKVQPQAEYHDYIYRTNDLAALKGNRFSKKRNLIRQFNSEFVAPGRVVVDNITGANVAECLDFLEDWCQARDCDQNPDEDLACEKQAAVNALAHFENMALAGIAVRIDDRVSAFGIAAPLTTDMGVLHFEKAHTDIKGLYQFLDQQCAQRLFHGMHFINKESDMGIAGIAQAKKSYHPIRMVKSYQLIVR